MNDSLSKDVSNEKEQKNSSEARKTEYIRERQKQVRFFANMYLGTNIVFQLPILIKPDSEMHLKMNIGYTISNLISIILMAVTYSNPEKLCYVTPSMLILNLKYIIRCLDIEDTRSRMTTDEWESLLINNVIVIV